MSRNLVTKGRALAGQIEIRDGAVVQYHRISISTASSSEADTGFKLPEQSLVVDAFVHVKTAAAATVLDVGLLATTSGDADGFIDGLDVSSSGLVGPGFVVSTSGAGVKFYGSNTWGVLLSDFLAGTTAATGGLAQRKHHASDDLLENAVSVSPDTTVALVADVYLGLVDLHTSE